MRTVAIVQARAASTRLPVKVLLDLAGKTALERCLRRVEQFRGVADTVVATGDAPENDVIEIACRRLGFSCLRGSETDVLQRYLDAASNCAADVVVRCTSDCPLLDPVVSSTVIDEFFATAASGRLADYASNTLHRHLPRGLDTEVVRIDALARVASEGPSPSDLEHVTLGVVRQPDKFALHSVVIPDLENLSSHRWTLDTLSDYRFLAGLYEALGPRAESAGLRDVLDVLAKHPQLIHLNAHVRQKAPA